MVMQCTDDTGQTRPLCEAERSGQATLSFVLLVSGIIIEVAIAGGFIAYALSSSSRGEQLSQRAFTAATVGIGDVAVRLARDTALGGTGTLSYTLPVGAATAFIEVSRDATTAGTYRYQATSTGTAGNRERRFMGVFAVDRIAGQVELQAFGEVPL